MLIFQINKSFGVLLMPAGPGGSEKNPLKETVCCMFGMYDNRMMRLLLCLSALAASAHGQEPVVFRPPVFSLGSGGLPDISGGPEYRPWGDHASW